MVNNFLKLAILLANYVFCIYNTYSAGNTDRQVYSGAGGFLRNIICDKGIPVSTGVKQPSVKSKYFCIPRSVKEINQEDFLGVHSEQISFETNMQIKTIGWSAFGYYYRNLKSICIPCSVNIIENDAFRHCCNLRSVTFEEGSILLKIGDSAFRNTAITSITIPDYVRTFVIAKKLKRIV
jgi:hypothetical protein